MRIDGHPTDGVFDSAGATLSVTAVVMSVTMRKMIAGAVSTVSGFLTMTRVLFSAGAGFSTLFHFILH